LCCDVSEEWTAIAREAWEEAGVADRIELKIAPAAETLRALPEGEQFDFAFIDADKTGYPTYFEEILPRLRTGGLVLIDNVLQNGRVIDRSADDESVVVIRQLNDAIVKDDRVRVVLLPIGDGVSVVQKL
jgi:caffeoyl-CoA O-methyltransferase